MWCDVAEEAYTTTIPLASSNNTSHSTPASSSSSRVCLYLPSPSHRRPSRSGSYLHNADQLSLICFGMGVCVCVQPVAYYTYSTIYIVYSLLLMSCDRLTTTTILYYTTNKYLHQQQLIYDTRRNRGLYCCGEFIEMFPIGWCIYIYFRIARVWYREATRESYFRSDWR